MNHYKWAASLGWLFLWFSGIIILLLLLEFYFMDNYRSEKLAELSSVSGAAFSMQQAEMYQFSQNTVEDYVDIVEKPIFFKGRRAILIEDIEEDAVTDNTINKGEKIPHILIGIINTPHSIYALFQDPKAASHEDKFLHLTQGEDINGWLIQEIFSDRVLLTSGAETEEVLLAKPRVPARKKFVRNARNKRHSTKLKTKK